MKDDTRFSKHNKININYIVNNIILYFQKEWALKKIYLRLICYLRLTVKNYEKFGNFQKQKIQNSAINID